MPAFKTWPTMKDLTPLHFPRIPLYLWSLENSGKISLQMSIGLVLRYKLFCDGVVILMLVGLM